MYDDIASSVLSDFKIPEVYKILQGSYKFSNALQNSEELKTSSSQNNGGGIVKILKFQGKVLFQKKKKLFRF